MNAVTKVDRSVFANSAPIAKQAFDMPRIGGHVAEAAQKAAQALLATRIPVDGECAETRPGADLAKPMLAPPAAPVVKGMNSAAILTRLLGELNVVLGESGLNELENRLSIFRGMADARQKALVKVSKEFEQAVGVTEDAAALYEAAKGETAAAQSKADSAREQADAAESELASVQADDPSRPELLRKNEAAQKTLQAATHKLHGAVENEKRYSADLMQKLKAATDIETQANGALAAVPNKPQNLEMSSSAARLSLLMSELTKIIGEGSDAALQNDQKLFKEMQARRQKAMEKSADDYDAEVAKADKISKTMGCIGKIVGYLVLAVSIVALPFTGGASLALAVIGIGLTAADAITSAVTGGTSLTDMAMGPIMSGVIQPIIELLTKAITEVLVAAGVPKEKAEMVAGIIAAVYVAIAMVVLMIAVAVVAKGPTAAKLASKLGGLISKGISKAAQSAVGRGIKAAVKPMAKAISKQAAGISKKLAPLTKGISNGASKLKGKLNDSLHVDLNKLKDPETIKGVTKTLDYASTGIGAANAMTQAGGNVAHGVFVKNAANAEADLVLSQNVLKQLDKLLRKAAEQFSEMKNTGNDLTVVASEAAQRHADAARFVASRMRG